MRRWGTAPRPPTNCATSSRRAASQPAPSTARSAGWRRTTRRRGLAAAPGPPPSSGSTCSRYRLGEDVLVTGLRSVQARDQLVASVNGFRWRRRPSRAWARRLWQVALNLVRKCGHDGGSHPTSRPHHRRECATARASSGSARAAKAAIALSARCLSAATRWLRTAVERSWPLMVEEGLRRSEAARCRAHWTAPPLNPVRRLREEDKVPGWSEEGCLSKVGEGLSARARSRQPQDDVAVALAGGPRRAVRRSMTAASNQPARPSRRPPSRTRRSR